MWGLLVCFSHDDHDVEYDCWCTKDHKREHKELLIETLEDYILCFLGYAKLNAYVYARCNICL